MIRFTSTTVVLLTAPVVLLTGCGGGPSEADRKVCTDAANLVVSYDSSGVGTYAVDQAATDILSQLSGYAPDDARLVRAVDHAREDARSVVAATDWAAIDGDFSALDGSVSAINGVCKELGV